VVLFIVLPFCIKESSSRSEPAPECGHTTRVPHEAPPTSGTTIPCRSFLGAEARRCWPYEHPLICDVTNRLTEHRRSLLRHRAVACWLPGMTTGRLFSQPNSRHAPGQLQRRISALLTEPDASSKGVAPKAAPKATTPTATVGLYFMYYNFGHVHQTRRVNPAMEAGISDHVWSVEEIVGLLA
jgi:hypothetical protein